MTNRIAAGLQVALIVLLSLAALAVFSARADASEGHWRAGRVGLGDATTAPTVLTLLRPSKRVTYAHGVEGWNCFSHGRTGWFSDVQAYSWQGYAIGAQRWDDDLPGYYWRVPQRGHDGRVTFDGITFENRSHVPVLVAGWCE